MNCVIPMMMMHTLTQKYMYSTEIYRARTSLITSSVVTYECQASGNPIRQDIGCNSRETEEQSIKYNKEKQQKVKVVLFHMIDDGNFCCCVCSSSFFCKEQH